MVKEEAIITEIKVAIDEVKALDTRLPDILNTEDGMRHFVYQLAERIDALEKQLKV